MGANTLFSEWIGVILTPSRRVSMNEHMSRLKGFHSRTTGGLPSSWQPVLHLFLRGFQDFLRAEFPLTWVASPSFSSARDLVPLKRKPAGLISNLQPWLIKKAAQCWFEQALTGQALISSSVACYYCIRTLKWLSFLFYFSALHHRWRIIPSCFFFFPFNIMFHSHWRSKCIGLWMLQ